jgi:hypothetical protein
MWTLQIRRMQMVESKVGINARLRSHGILFRLPASPPMCCSLLVRHVQTSALMRVRLKTSSMTCSVTQTLRLELLRMILSNAITGRCE